VVVFVLLIPKRFAALALLELGNKLLGYNVLSVAAMALGAVGRIE
jgi:hypothetical protein